MKSLRHTHIDTCMLIWIYIIQYTFLSSLSVKMYACQLFTIVTDFEKKKQKRQPVCLCICGVYDYH